MEIPWVRFNRTVAIVINMNVNSTTMLLYRDVQKEMWIIDKWGLGWRSDVPLLKSPGRTSCWFEIRVKSKCSWYIHRVGCNHGWMETGGEWMETGGQVNGNRGKWMETGGQVNGNRGPGEWKQGARWMETGGSEWKQGKWMENEGKWIETGAVNGIRGWFKETCHTRRLRTQG